jgi:hypothetical protein
LVASASGVWVQWPSSSRSNKSDRTVRRPGPPCASPHRRRLDRWLRGSELGKAGVRGGRAPTHAGLLRAPGPTHARLLRAPGAFMREAGFSRVARSCSSLEAGREPRIRRGVSSWCAWACAGSSSRAGVPYAGRRDAIRRAMYLASRPTPPTVCELNA